MSYAIRIHAIGGTDVLKVEETRIGDPGPAEARIRHHAIGLNFVETYLRTGLYPVPLPSGLGPEAAGIVEAVGVGVDEIRVGDRVAYAGGPQGAYADVRLVPADRLVKLPDSLSFEQAAAIFLKGLTAQYLLRQVFRVKRGDTILFHAAAGGVGLIACQWARRLGATVIGTVGSDEKAAFVKAHGCDHAVVYTRESFVERVKALTGGEGLPVVYDSVGKTTFMDSLACLRPFGMLVSFGQSSGPVPPFDIGELSRRGSLFLTRPTLVTYGAKRADLLAMAAELFEAVQSGGIRVEIGGRYPLREVARAHTDLEARRTIGSSILLP